MMFLSSLVPRPSLPTNFDHLECVVPYSGKLSREKTFMDFAFLWLFAKVFSVKFGGVASFGTAQASDQRRFSLRKLYFSPIHKVFSLESFLLYGIQHTVYGEWQDLGTRLGCGHLNNCHLLKFCSAIKYFVPQKCPPGNEAYIFLPCTITDQGITYIL